MGGDWGSMGGESSHCAAVTWKCRESPSYPPQKKKKSFVCIHIYIYTFSISVCLGGKGLSCMHGYGSVGQVAGNLQCGVEALISI